MRFEPLETRQLLSVTVPELDPIAGGTFSPIEITVAAGAPLNLALDVANVSGFTINSSNPNLATGTVYNSLYNRTLELTVKSDDNAINGVMTFQLFEQLVPNTTGRIISLANSNFYDGVTFHRVIKNFMIQGGDPAGTGSGGSNIKFDDEFNALLQHTSTGILSMAKSQDDTNDSQFFITSEPTRWLDFNHTVFGFLTSGNELREQIENVNTTSDRPNSPVRIVDARIINDNSHAVLQLAAPANAPVGGTTSITVTAWTNVAGEGYKEVTQVYNVKVVADKDVENKDIDSLPFLNNIAPIQTTVNTPVTLTIPATDVEGNPISYWAGVDNNIINVAVNSSTGSMTITPPSNLAAGVYSVWVAVTDPKLRESLPANEVPWDIQQVPVYIKPNAPTVQLLTSSDTGSSSTDRLTKLNNANGNTLSFLVSGTVAGAKVSLYADGTLIGSGTATGSSLTIQTNNTFTLSDGAHQITAKQVLENKAVNVGNTHTSVNLASALSTTLSVTVDATGPTITSTDPTEAVDGQQFVYDVQATEEATAGAIAFRLGANAPAGMVINAQTGVITWTPDRPYASHPVTYIVEDKAGNAVQRTFNLHVPAVNAKPTAIAPTIPYIVPNTSVFTINLTGSDNDPEVEQVLRYKIITLPQRGELSGLDDDNFVVGTLTYTPNEGADNIGVDSFQFIVIDDSQAGDPANLESDPATVVLHVVNENQQPVAIAADLTTNEDTPLAITLTGDDGDPQFNQVLRYKIVQQPAHGTLINFNPATGAVTYVPHADYNGPDEPDEFTFTVIDDNLAGNPTERESAPATISITVNPVNDPPAASDQTVSIKQNESVLVQLIGSDGDPELDQPLVFAIVGQPSHGTLTGFDPATGKVTYVPNENFSGTDTFSFKVTETEGGLASTVRTVAISVAPVNNPPVANPQTVTTAEDTAIVIQLTGNDGDPEVNQSLRYAIVQSPASGRVLEFNPAMGRVVYLPGADFNGTDQFRFTVTDDTTAGLPVSLTSAPVAVTINVTPVDDAPRFLPATGNLIVLQTQTLPISVQAFDVDQASTIVYSIDPSAPEGLVLDETTGQIAWTVPVTFPSGTFVLRVRATEMTDGQAGLSSTQDLAIEIVNIAALFDSRSGSSASGAAGGDFSALDAVLASLAQQPEDQQGSQSVETSFSPIPTGGASVTGSPNLFGEEIDPSAGAGSHIDPSLEGQSPTAEGNTQQKNTDDGRTSEKSRDSSNQTSQTGNSQQAPEQVDDQYQRTSATDRAVEELDFVAYEETAAESTGDETSMFADGTPEHQASDAALKELADEAMVGQWVREEEYTAL